MKFTTLMMLVLGLNVWAQDNQDLVLQKALYTEMRSEGLITEFEYSKKNQALDQQISLQKQQQINALKLNLQPTLKTRGPGGTSSITGTITSGGVVQENVGLTLYEFGSNNFIDFVTTSAAGVYSFNNLTAGDYFVAADDTADAFVNAMYSSLGAEQCQSNCQADADNVISLAAASTVSGINLDLQVGATLSGNVSDGSNPLQNIFLAIRNLDYFYYAGVQTDASGNYSVSGLPSGNFAVLAEDQADIYISAMWSAAGTEQCPGFCSPDADNATGLLAGDVVAGIDLVLNEGGSISGIITDGVNPISDYFVRVRSYDDSYSATATTDATGSYTALGLPPGDYYVVADNFNDIYINAIWSTTGTEFCNNCAPDTDNTITLAAMENRAGVDLTLTEGATLTGQIVDAATSAAVESLYVRLVDTSGSIASTLNSFYATQFDGSGNYTVTGIPQGSYRVLLEPNISTENVYVPEIYNNIQCNLCSLQAFNGAGDVINLVNGSSTSGIDFLLETGASVSGQVLNSEVMPAEPMTQRALVYLFDASNRIVATRFMLGTDFDPAYTGDYTIGGLLPGTYFAQGGDLGSDFFQRELYDDIHCPWSGCDRGAGGTPIVLGVGENRLGIDFMLEYGGKISGTVTDAATGNPIDSDATQYVQFYDSSGAVVGGAGINPDGTYTSQRALPPGTYSVRTGTMFHGIFNAPYVMEKYDPMGNIDCPGVTCDLTAGNVVVTDNNTVTGIDFALSTANSFSGTITDLNPPNAPIPDVHVLVYDDNGKFANWATTDNLGNFTVSGLPNGTYYALTNNGSDLPFMGLNAAAVGTWVDILFDGIPCPGSTCNVLAGDPIVLPAPAPFVEGVGDSLNFTMTNGGSITGHINTFDRNIPGSFVGVKVYNQSGLFLGSYAADENGDYLTAGLPDGTYYLVTQNDGALVDVKYGNEYCYDDSCDPLDAVAVVIENGQAISGINFELKTDYIFKSGLD